MKQKMAAIIRKDLRNITTNKNLFLSLLIVPLVFTIIFPSILVCAIHFMPDDPDIQKMLELLPMSLRSGNMELDLMGMILNYILPVFFLIIPVMAASIMSASAFVGEKEKHTLETLLYCPLSVKQIFCAKVMASFFLSMLISFISFLAMLLVLEAETLFLMGSFLLPGISWFVILFLISPSVSLIAITLIVRGSAKAQSGRVPAGRCFSGDPAASAGCGTVYGSASCKHMDFVGIGSTMRFGGRTSSEKINGTVQL